MTKGVIVELDFAVFKGAEIFRSTAQQLLEKAGGIPFNAKIEAQYFVGNEYMPAFTKYFAAIGTKRTALKATNDFTSHSVARLEESAVASGVSDEFVRFVGSLVDSGIRVLLLTRCGEERMMQACLPVLSDLVTVITLPTCLYGCNGREQWVRACRAIQQPPNAVTAVVGSGFSLKSAMQIGASAVAVTNPFVEYQDFSGALDISDTFSERLAKRAMR